MKLFLCVFAVLALTRAEENPLRPLTEHMRKQAEDINSTDLSGNINEIVDQVVGEIGPYFVIADLDPLKLSDIEEGFDWKPLIITYHGALDLTKGYVHGLSSVERAGDASLHHDTNLLRAKMGFLFDNLTINYDYLVKLMDIGPRGEVDAVVTNTELHFDIVLDMEDSTFHVEDFNITEIGKIKVNFGGNRIPDMLINPLTGVATPLFKRLIRKDISDNIENVIKNLLKDNDNEQDDR